MHTKENRKRKNCKTRTLRVESLETRQLLSADVSGAWLPTDDTLMVVAPDLQVAPPQVDTTESTPVAMAAATGGYDTDLSFGDSFTYTIKGVQYSLNVGSASGKLVVNGSVPGMIVKNLVLYLDSSTSTQANFHFGSRTITAGSATNIIASYSDTYTFTLTYSTGKVALKHLHSYFPYKTPQTWNYSGTFAFNSTNPISQLATPEASVLKVSTSRLQVNWNAVPNASCYQIYYRAVGASSWTYAATQSVTRYQQINGLDAGKTYEVRVQALSGSRSYANSGYSGTARINLSTGVSSIDLAAPRISSSATGNTITVSWSAVPHADSYQVYFNTSSANASRWSYYTVTGATQKSFTGENGKTYYIKVRAMGATGYDDSSFSGVLNQYVRKQLATPVVQTKSFTESTITLKWAKVAGATSYTVMFRPASSSSWTTGTVTSAGAVVNSLQSGTTYYFTVQANSNSSLYLPTSNWSSQTFTSRTRGQLATPSITSVEQVGKKMTVTWSEVSNAAKYTLFYKKAESSRWTKTTSSTTSKTISVSPGYTYNFQVMAVSTQKLYANSLTSATRSTFVKYPIVTPKWTSTTVTDHSLQLKWKAAEDAGGYYIWIKRKDAATSYSWQRYSTTQTVLTFTGLDANTLYQVKIQAFPPNASLSTFSLESGIKTIRTKKAS